MANEPEAPSRRPKGRHDWLNHLVFVGGLHAPAPRPQAPIRVFSLS